MRQQFKTLIQYNASHKIPDFFSMDAYLQLPSLLKDHEHHPMLLLSLFQNRQEIRNEELNSFLSQCLNYEWGLRELIGLRQLALEHRYHHTASLIKSHISPYFKPGFLQVKQMDFDSTGPDIRKLLMERESVHQIKNEQELKKRMNANNRSCFGLFHASFQEPLCVVYTAKTKDMPSSIQSILELREPESAEDAKNAHVIFYSISSLNPGLASLNLGNILIQKLLRQAQAQTQQILTFATLSPIPGFRSFVERHEEGKLTTEKEKELLEIYLKKTLNGRAIDPVEHFHLRNGAKVGDIHYQGDTSDKGIKQSFGWMVNYLYEPPFLVQRHLEYSQKTKIHHSFTVKEGKNDEEEKSSKL